MADENPWADCITIVVGAAALAAVILATGLSVRIAGCEGSAPPPPSKVSPKAEID